MPKSVPDAACAGTLRPIPTEPLCIPDLCLAGRLPQQHNAVFNLDLSAANAVPGAAADVTAWPEFHNGVAAGIRLAPGGGGLTRTWVVYNKPKTPNYTHAGMLMGLGLAGAQSSRPAVVMWNLVRREEGVEQRDVLCIKVYAGWRHYGRLCSHQQPEVCCVLPTWSNTHLLSRPF